MLKCLKDVGVRSSHFTKEQKELVVSVKAGDLIEVKDKSAKVLLDSGYFEAVEKKPKKLEEVEPEQ